MLKSIYRRRGALGDEIIWDGGSARRGHAFDKEQIFVSERHAVQRPANLPAVELFSQTLGSVQRALRIDRDKCIELASLNILEALPHSLGWRNPSRPNCVS